MPTASRTLWLLAAAGASSRAGGAAPKPTPNCDGAFKITGSHGSDQILIPTGWKNKDGYPDIPVTENALVAQMGARAYFADTCTAGTYNNTDYMRANLLGKTLKFTTDITGAGCGCNAALYLTSMGHNPKVSDCNDHYCDANNVCGQSCAEIDIMEGNQHAWHSTLHTATDNDGSAAGFGGGGTGWNGPRSWTEKEYGLGGSCIDTAKPFNVAVSFPIDQHGILVAMQVVLSQEGHNCSLNARVDDYSEKAMKELTHALLDGMTPIVSYWADKDMLWLDGVGDDKKGPCKKDNVTECAASVKFHSFSIEDLTDDVTKALEKAALEQDADMKKKYGDKDKDKDTPAGGNEWWTPEQQGEGEKKVAGSDEWDGQAGTDSWNADGSQEGNEWWHPDKPEGKHDDKKDADDWDTEKILMQKNEIHSGRLRGTAEAGGPKVAVFLCVAAGAGALLVAAVAVAVRRGAPSTSSGDAASDAAGAASRGSLGSTGSLRRLRGSFGSRGDLGGQESPSNASPMPMLQQPPSTQNLLMMGSLETQAA